MLDCKKIQPKLSEYLDGTLPENESWDVQMHLSSCAVCTRASAELAATVRLVSSLPERGPSENFDDKLAARLANIVLTPHPQTFREKLAAFWQRPAARPAVASGLALMALAPACFFLLRPAPPKPAVEDAVLTQIVREHADFASAEPLANPSDLLSDTLESEGL
ncbi:MAG: zf-HC2 domain-containing protein [Armatimonas sp.]